MAFTGRPLIILLGFRGSGKSTLAPLLAKQLAWPWLDMDQEITTQSRLSISEIFAQHGESQFREWETEALRQALAETDPKVLATGGGCILRLENQEMLKNSGGWMVYLATSPLKILSRIQADHLTEANRPKLLSLPLEEEIKTLLIAREPIYRDLADFIIDTSCSSPEVLANNILAAWTSIATRQSFSG